MQLSQSLQLSQSQRLKLAQNQRLSLKLDLIGALRSETYLPEAVCPTCRCILLPIDILKGFRADPDDLTTSCPECGQRFKPKLAWSNAHTRKEIGFLCELQTEERMRGRGLEKLSPEEFERLNSSVYHSAIVHHGSLKNAFAAMGIAYAFDEIADVKTKIEPFLGKLFDTTIAKLSGVDVEVVRQMRKSAKISRCIREGAYDDW